jgi:transcription elongation factor/antiterminator RfaH
MRSWQAGLDGELHWYAVQTKPRQEDRVRDWLSRRGTLSVFLPKVEHLRRRRSRRVTVVEPLFPSYLFVRMTLEPAAWYTVKWTPGVKHVVCTGEIPTPVPREAMQLLRERYREGDVLRWVPVFRAGEPVRIVHGPLSGLDGILERPCSRGDRVRVLLSLLGGMTPVEVDVTDIEAVA